MKYVILHLFLIISSFAGAQTDGNWEQTLQLQPELTFHKKYTLRRDGGIWATPNTGFVSAIQKNLNKKLFVGAGVGYISRRLNLSADFDYYTMFPGENMPAVEHTARNVSYKTLHFPVGFGVNFFNSEAIRIFAKATYIPKLVLGTKYHVKIGSFEPENYFYSENYWQGHAVNAGIGFDFRVHKKLSLTNAIAYTLVNTVKKDLYISYAYNKITPNHNYLQLSSGIKINLH